MVQISFRYSDGLSIIILKHIKEETVPQASIYTKD